MAEIVKWKEIYKDLKEEIISGRYKNGDKFLRIKDICERFNVSKITAIKVLDELERENLIKQKQKVGGIVKKFEGKFYLIVPEKFIENPFYDFGFTTSEILKGIVEESLRENIDVKFINERFFLKNFKDDVCFVLCRSLNPEIEEKILSHKNTKIIFLHSYHREKNVHTVRHDVYKGAYIGTEYLIKKGYRRIGFLGGPLNKEGFLLRFEGYLCALKESGIDFNLNLVKETGEEVEENIKAFEELLKMKCDGVFCANDIRAIHILEYCNKNKIKVPDEIGICGFDNRPETEMTNPKLTTVDTKLKEIGKEAIRHAIKIYEGKVKEIEDIVIEPELKERETA